MNLLPITLLKLKPKTIILIILTLIPFIYLFLNILFYGFRYPYLDQWDLVPLIVKSFNGTLTFSDLFSLYNEHRPFFPRLIMLLVANLTHWNIFFELIINIVLGLVIFSLITAQLRFTILKTSIHKMYWLIPVISVLCFSIVQWENWAWGWQIQIFLSIATSICGIIILSQYPSNNKKFLAAIILGIIAIFSFASGIAYWIVGLLSLGISNIQPQAQNKLKTLIWALVGTILILIYYNGFKHPSHHPEYINIQATGKLLTYFLAYLGSPLSPSQPYLAIIFGMLSVLLGVLTPFFLLKYFKYEIISPYISIIVFVALNGLITGFGRAALGLNQALSGRYTSFSLLIWTSEIILLCLLFIKLNNHKNEIIKNISQKMILVCLGLIFLFTLSSNIEGTLRIQYMHNKLLSLKKDVLTASNLQSLHYIYRNEDKLPERITQMKLYKLSIFK